MWSAYLATVITLLLIRCSNTDIREIKPYDRFIYISHTRLKGNDSIYEKVYDIDFSKYSINLFGGDLAQKSFKDEKIIAHLDDIFDLKDPKTLFSIGNHDVTSDKTFKEYTNKEKYGLYQQEDVSFVLLDSQDSLSSIVGRQKEFLLTVIDTITTPKVLFMSHKLIFMDQYPIMDTLINSICNGIKGDCYFCHNTNNFREDIYPELLKLRESGKEVFLIGGDLGKKTSRFEYTDENGIVFLGNGLWYENEDNYVILFKNEEKIKYEFVHIDTLLKNQ